MAEKQSYAEQNKARLKEITDSIETGIRELFQSDKYKQYLTTMSRFHKYSVNNTMLIYMQKPDASLVAGFNKWKDQFERNVKKGEKGIKIIAPTPYKKKIEEAKLDPDTKAPILDADGNAVMEEKTIQIPMYKVVSVFDVSQTAGKPLPELAANLTGDVQNYEVFMEALRRSSPVPIDFKPLPPDTDGIFYYDRQAIDIREGMSEVQTVCAAVHEITHSKLHNYQKAREQAAAGDETALPVKRKSRETEEIEAESISYAVCAYYGIETGANSFGYLASWSKDKELSALRESLETINKTSSGLISDIDRHYRDIMKERGLDKAEPEQTAPAVEYLMHANPRATGEADRCFVQAYTKQDGELIPGEVIGIGTAEQCREVSAALTSGKMTAEDARAALAAQPEALYLVDGTTYLHIQESNGGYDYTLYDKAAMREIDGGRLDAPDIPINAACQQICALHDMDGASMEYAPLAMLAEINEAIDRRQERDVASFERQNPPSPFSEPPMETAEQQPGYEEWSEPATAENAPEQPDTPSDDVSAYLPDEPPLGGGNIVGVSIEQYDPDASLPPIPDGYPMPDPTLTMEDMHSYGYTENDMLPLSKERAIELLEKDMTVYMLYEGNGAGMAFDRDDIDGHIGMFGVNREEWDEAREYLELTEGHELTDRELENSFLHNPADAFAIYQLKHTEDTRDLRFEPLERVTAAGMVIDRDNYDLVYTGELPANGSTGEKLENLFYTFNMAHPEDFKGHSLSVSDIVALKQSGAVSCHYCDSAGFKELPTFLKPDNYLKTAEMSMEDDYGMIDGIVNNGKAPTVAELEQQAKSGQPISLMDLAEAAHRERDHKEKKPSVLAQLKSYQSKEKTNTAPKKSAEREI